MSRSNQSQLNQLRAHAEALLADMGKAGADQIAISDMATLMHDLSVHQIELEMQNEELLKVQRDLQRTQDEYHALYHSVPVGYLTLDRHGMIIKHNQTFSSMLQEDSRNFTGTPFTNFIVSEDQGVFLARFKAFLKSPQEKNIDLRLIRQDGALLWVRLTGRPGLSIYVNDKEMPTLLLAVSDITREKIAEEEENQSLKATLENFQQSQGNYEKVIGDSNANQLRAEMALMELEQIFSAYTDGMWVIREDGVVVRVNQPMLDLLGKTKEEVIGHNCSELLEYELCAQDGCPLRNIEFPKTRELDIQFLDDLDERHFLLTTSSLLTIDGIPGIVARFKDITIRKRAEKALEEANLALAKTANTDGLTGIPNRRCFDLTLNKEWKRLLRSQKPISLLLGDIDFFKKYNDFYGHQAGDDCLRMVAQALEGAILRPCDLVARYGGEEFVLLLPETDIEGALQIGQRVLDAIAELKIPHKKSDVRSSISISLGAATVIPESTFKPKDLIALADAALYEAKDAGRNQIIISKSSMAQFDKFDLSAFSG